MASSRRVAGSRAQVRTVLEARLPIVRRVCRRVAAGETVQDICRDPMMPLRQELHAWVAEEPEFRAMMAAARRRSGRPGLARGGRPGDWSEKTETEFLARIADGRGLVEVCSEPDMPTHTTIYRWLRLRPDFAERYAEARQLQSDLLFDLAWSLARGAREDDIAAARLMIQTIKWRCARLAPRRYGTAAEAARLARAEAADEADEDAEPEEIDPATDSRPLRIMIRHFGIDPDDPDKVVQVYPENPEVFVMDRSCRKKKRRP